MINGYINLTRRRGTRECRRHLKYIMSLGSTDWLSGSILSGSIHPSQM